MSNSKIKSLLCIGYSFIYKGRYCLITRFNSNGFHYSIQSDKVNIGYMNYSFFKTTNHFKGKFSHYV